MSSLDYEPIPDHAALIAGECLVVTDLHIGLEAEINRHGVYVTSQTERMADTLVGLIDKHGPRRLILLGDVKHFIPGISPLERRDLPRFFDRVSPTVEEVHIASGNHDARLRQILREDIRIHPPSGFALEGFGFVHGHAWPSEEVMAASVLFAGHNHPAFVSVDRLGHRSIDPVWMRVRLRRNIPKYSKVADELVVLPSFNPLCGGTPVNDTAQELLGPLTSPQVSRIEEADLHLLDGAHLGRLGDLRVDARIRVEDYRQ